jgi:hypothetical protein
MKWSGLRGSDPSHPYSAEMTAVRRVVLPARDGQMVVFVDEIDVVQSMPFSTREFFAAIGAGRG